MRLLAVLGVTTLVGCSLDLGGVATGGSDAQAMDEESSSGVSGDVNVSADTPISTDESSVGADASDGGLEEEAATSLDAYVPDATTSAGDASADGMSDSAASDMSAPEISASDVSTSDVSASDSSSDAPTTSACVSAIPNGWSLIIYDLGTDSCPPTFPAHDVAGTTTIEAGACSCNCTVTQNGGCALGTLNVHPSVGNGACDLDAGWSKDLNGTGCTVLGVTLSVAGPHSDQATPLPGQGGTCSDAPQADQTKIAAAPTRYCEVPPPGADSVCNGTVPSGFAACIMRNGQTTCPSGTPFVHGYLVEDGAALQCSSCAGCTVTTTCSNATLTGFSDMACSPQSLVGSVDIDGGCNPANLTTYPSSLVAIEYSATASSTCTPGSSTPSAKLTNPRTICCR
jgi:hypothetical protein